MNSKHTNKGPEVSTSLTMRRIGATARCVVFAAALVANGCGAPEDVGLNASERVLNGTPVEAALIEGLGMPRIPGCSSTMLRNDWILTAAHCVDTARDHALGGDGRVTTAFSGTTWDGALAVVVDAQGRILAAGTSLVDGASRFSVARYLPDGTADTSFSSDGHTTTNITTSTEEAVADLAIDGQGRVVAAGWAVIGGRTYIALARYLAGGQLDATFGGGDGVLTTAFPGTTANSAQAVAVQPDGRILVAGSATIDGRTRFALARYLADGSPDTTLDGDGLATVEFSGSESSSAHDLVLDASGRAVLVGNARFGSGATSLYRFALTRLFADGTVDTAFGGGRVMAPLYSASSMYATAATLDMYGRVVVAGSARVDGADQVAVARYTAAGVADTSFASRGSTFFRGADLSAARAWGVAVDTAGRIVVGGGGTNDGEDGMMAARFLASGAPDPSFNRDGMLTVDFSSSTYQNARAVALDAAGNIVLAGSAKVDDRERYAVARVLPNQLDVALAEPITVRLGAQSVTADRALKPTGNVDACLLHLSTPLRVNNATTGYTRALYTGATSNLVGRSLNCYGYGYDRYVPNGDGTVHGEGSGTLRTAILRVRESTPSSYVLEASGDTRDGGQAIAQGDSGGSCLFNTTSGAVIAGVHSTMSWYPSTGQVVSGTDTSAEAFRAWVSTVLPH